MFLKIKSPQSFLQMLLKSKVGHLKPKEKKEKEKRLTSPSAIHLPAVLTGESPGMMFAPKKFQRPEIPLTAQDREAIRTGEQMYGEPPLQRIRWKSNMQKAGL